MGKTKQTKRRNKRDNPTGIPSVKDVEAEEEEMGIIEESACPSDTVLNNIVDNLQGQVEDKIFALHSLASIFQTPDSIKHAVHQKIARIAAPLLMDKSYEVRNAAAAALRNLTASGIYEICDVLIEQDIMTPLTALLHQYADEKSSQGKAVDSEMADTFGQAVLLLRNLCEGNSRAVFYFNEGNLLPVLLKYLSGAPDHINVTLAIVQCLITVIEDNSKVRYVLEKSETDLHKILGLEGNNSALMLLRVLTSGVILKLHTKEGELLNPVLLNTIVSPLLVDHRQELHKLSSREPGELAEDHAALNEIAQLMEAQQVSLELLTNLCADSDDEAMDLDSSCSLSDEMEEEMNGTNTSGCEDEADLNGPSVLLTPELYEAIVSQQLVQRIWEKTRVPAVNVCSLLHEHSGGQHLLESVTLLRARAFQCLNNLISALDIQDIGGAQELFRIWSETSVLVFKSTDEDCQVLEAASAAMRAALQKFAQTSPEHPYEVQLQDIEFIFNSGPNADASIRANVVKTAGMMGMITLPHTTENSYKVVKKVGKFLLDTCGHENELWVLAEALDSIMDLFGEDETDQVASELGLVDKLQALLPSFRRKVQVNKRKLGDHYALVSTVNTNLPRFIHYKANRLS